MQDRGLLTNFSINVKLNQIMVIDQMQLIYAYYSFKNPDANDADSQASA